MVVVIVPLLVAAILVRILAVPALRPDHPEAAAFVERNWAWLPMVGFVVLVSLWSWPFAALAAAIGTLVIARPGLFGLPPQ